MVTGLMEDIFIAQNLKTLNTFLQALKQRKAKGFVTTPIDSKNVRSGLQTVHFSTSAHRECTVPLQANTPKRTVVHKTHRPCQTSCHFVSLNARSRPKRIIWWLKRADRVENPYMFLFFCILDLFLPKLQPNHLAYLAFNLK